MGSSAQYNDGKARVDCLLSLHSSSGLSSYKVRFKPCAVLFSVPGVVTWHVVGT